MVNTDATVDIQKETLRERFNRVDKLTTGFVTFSYIFFGIFLILPVVVILFASLQDSMLLEGRTDRINLIYFLFLTCYIIIPYIGYKLIARSHKKKIYDLLSENKSSEDVSPLYLIISNRKLRLILIGFWFLSFIFLFIIFFGEDFAIVFSRQELWGGRFLNVGFSETIFPEQLIEANPNPAFAGLSGTKWILQGPDLGAIGNSLFVATLTTFFSLILGAGTALIMARSRFAGKTFLRSILLLPLIIPPFVGTIGFETFFGINGIINDGFLFPLLNFKIVFGGNFGIIFIQTLHFYTLVYLNSYSSLVNIDPSLEEQAENMGASSFNLLRKITLPLATPGIAAGAILTFILSLEDLGTPLIFSSLTQTLQFEYMTTYVLTNLQIPSITGYFIINPVAAALATIMVVIAMVGFLIIRKFVSLKRYAMISKGRVGEPRAKDASKLRRILIYLFFIIFMPIALTPHVGTFIFAVNDSATNSLSFAIFATLLGEAGINLLLLVVGASYIFLPYFIYRLYLKDRDIIRKNRYISWILGLIWLVITALVFWSLFGLDLVIWSTHGISLLISTVYIVLPYIIYQKRHGVFKKGKLSSTINWFSQHNSIRMGFYAIWVLSNFMISMWFIDLFNIHPQQKTISDELYNTIVGSIINMFWYSVFATFLIILIATVIAYVLARKEFPGKGILDTIVTLPLAIPGIVIGFGYLFIFYQETLPFPLNLFEPTTYNQFLIYIESVISDPSILLGGTIPILDAILNLMQVFAFPIWLIAELFVFFTGIKLSMDPSISPVLLLILAYTVRKFPFTVRAAYAGMSQTDIQLEEASLNLGASRITTIMKITLPMVAISLFAGSLISLVYCMSEVSTTILLVDFVPDPGKFATATWTIYDIYNSGMIGLGARLAAVLGLILMAIQSISIIVTSLILKSRSEALTGI